MIARRLLLAPACLLLAACATPRPVVLPPEQVDKPVPVSCLPATLPVAPRFYGDAELAKLDDYKLVLALWHNSDVGQAYIRELEAVLRACR